MIVVLLAGAGAAEDLAVAEEFAVEVDAFSATGAGDAVGLISGEFFGE